MPDARVFKQELVGVFGHPVAENPTQAMIEPAFSALGLNWRYLTVEVRPDQLAAAVRGALAMNWRGFNCTIPHKMAVIDHLDELTPAAHAIGAVNCVVIGERGHLLGDNTDGKGFVESVRAIRAIEGQHAVILGAGGAARAIAVELALAGAERIEIVNRDAARGAELAAHVGRVTGVSATSWSWTGMYRPSAETTLLVNATSIGLFPDVEARVPVELQWLDRDALVCDVIPNPPRTQLIREAETRGHEVLDGLGMLVNQGVIGIRLWTGQDPDARIMRQGLEEVFGV